LAPSTALPTNCLCPPSAQPAPPANLKHIAIEIERGREEDKSIKPFYPTDAAFESAAIKYTPIPSYYEQTFATYSIYFVYLSLDQASDEPRPHPPITSHTPSITTPAPPKATTAHCDHDTFLPSSLLQLRSPRLNLVAPLPLLFLAIGQQDLTLSSLRRQTNPLQSAGQQGREQKKKASRRLPPPSTDHSTPPPPADESPGAQPPAKPASSLNTNARARLRQTALELRALCANSIRNDTPQNQSESVPVDRPGHPSWAAAQRTIPRHPILFFHQKDTRQSSSSTCDARSLSTKFLSEIDLPLARTPSPGPLASPTPKTPSGHDSHSVTPSPCHSLYRTDTRSRPSSSSLTLRSSFAL
ncbi:hypothetical protein CNYM01_10417, partial [Colletotrichum nymphaeae SA-01]